ncbi:MAG: hypothetical protein P8J50_07795 [Acidimicrobiales bacterium]|nr:hypothetical protein [Acidimicrobiales bacterium]
MDEENDWTAIKRSCGDEITDEACANLGGTNMDTSDTWLVHVWLPVYDGWLATDIFNKEHPGIN